MSSMTVGRISFGPTTDIAEASAYRRQMDRLRNASLQMRTDSTVRACNCIGPQAGERKCPCALLAESQQGQQMIREGVVIDGVEYDLVPKRKPIKDD